MYGENKVPGADVTVRLGNAIVRIQIEETIVGVRVVVAADLSNRIASIGIRIGAAIKSGSTA